MPEDLVQLIRIGLEHPDIRVEIFYGASAAGWWGNSNAMRFGYKPQGRSENFTAEALAARQSFPRTRSRAIPGWSVLFR